MSPNICQVLNEANTYREKTRITRESRGVPFPKKHT